MRIDRHDIYPAIIMLIVVGMWGFIVIQILSLYAPIREDAETEVNCREIELHDEFYVDNGQGYLVENCRSRGR